MNSATTVSAPVCGATRDGAGSNRGAESVRDAGSGRITSSAWPLERALFLMAGTVTGLSAVLAALVSPWFLLLTGFVAVNQLLYVAVHNCGASLMLKRFAGLKSVVYPND